MPPKVRGQRGLRGRRKPAYKRGRLAALPVVRSRLAQDLVAAVRATPARGITPAAGRVDDAIDAAAKLESLRKPYARSDFENIKELGSGSYGQVFLVRRRKRAGDPGAGKEMVLKTLSKRGTGKIKATRADALVSEVSILQRLAPVCSEYIVCFDAFFEDADHYYITTQFLGGFSELYSLIEKDKLRDVRKDVLRQMLDNLASGLRLMHSKGIAHRDIKPENVLANPKTGEIRYIDFGLACMDGGCIDRHIVGTEDYWAPEIYFADEDRTLPFDLVRLQRGDVWSLGCVFFEMLNGLNPYTAYRENAKRINALFYGGLAVDFPSWLRTFEYDDISSPIIMDVVHVERKLADLESRYVRTLTTWLNRDPTRRPFSVAPHLASRDVLSRRIRTERRRRRILDRESTLS